jgi:hypothetical protein
MALRTRAARITITAWLTISHLKTDDGDQDIKRNRARLLVMRDTSGKDRNHRKRHGEHQNKDLEPHSEQDSGKQRDDRERQHSSGPMMASITRR